MGGRFRAAIEPAETAKFDLRTAFQTLFKNKKNVLSIGCGIGFIENNLVEKWNNGNYYLIEPSKVSLNWAKENKTLKIFPGYFPSALTDFPRIDLAYCIAIDYVFNEGEYIKFFLIGK